MSTGVKQDFSYRQNGQDDKGDTIRLGGCERICLVVDPVVVATVENSFVSNVLFHSTNPFYKLIDFFYRDENGHYHAFQVTLAETHSSNADHIKLLEEATGPSKVSLYYLVPSNNYNKFKTTPVSPRARCNIYVVMVKDPTLCGDVKITNS
jgi:hypothetical protein